MTSLKNHSKTSTVARAALPFAAWIAITSCGGGTDAANPPPPVVVVTVSVAPTTAQVIVGATTSLSATALSAAGVPITGRAVTWNTASAAIATVNAGVVTGVSAGVATISATIDNVTGAATVTVTAAPAVQLEVASGDQQRGLIGRPLADSLVVRVRTGGVPTPGAVVSWTASAGALSSASATTDAAGLARVQWTPAAGDATATASIPALGPVTFSANGRAGGACILAPSLATQRFSLGPTDYTLSLRATNPLRVAVLFVDFPDAPATEAPAALMASVVTPGVQLMEEMSYGRIDLTAVAFPSWYRMPQPIANYVWSTFAGHRAYLLDVLSITNASIDFSTFDALFVFAPPAPSKPVSPTFNGGSTANVIADGRNFGNAVTFGNDSRAFGPTVFAHETGHMLGLVDLYAYNPAGGATYPGNQFKYVGA